MIAYYEPEIILGLPPAQDKLAQRFDQFNRSNPAVYWAIRAKANELIAAGEERISMKGIFESLRGQFGHLNNSYTPFYTDLLVEGNPRFDAYFERRARAKGKMKRVYYK